MITQNETDLQAELINKTDNHIVCSDHCRGRILVQIK